MDETIIKSIKRYIQAFKQLEAQGLDLEEIETKLYEQGFADVKELEPYLNVPDGKNLVWCMQCKKKVTLEDNLVKILEIRPNSFRKRIIGHCPECDNRCGGIIG